MSDEREPSSEVSRRRFLTVLGTTSAGAAVLSGCSTEKVEKLIPYLVQSEDQVPGIPTWYASTLHRVQCRVWPARARSRGPPGQARGQSRQSDQQGRALRARAGRPAGALQPGARTRTDGEAGRHLEGDQLGRCDRHAGAEGRRGRRQARRHFRGRAGQLLQLPRRLGRRRRAARVVRYQPFDLEPVRAANARVFGRDEIPAYDFGAAKYIVSFGAEFLETFGSSTEYQLGYAESHGFTQGREPAKHVYFAPRASLTGLNADEWHAVVPGLRDVPRPRHGRRAPAAARRQRVRHASRSAWTRPRRRRACPPKRSRGWRRSLRRPSPSLAVAGGIGSQTAGATELCAAVNLLNFAAGNVGQTVRFGADLDHGDGFGALEALSRSMAAGEVEVLLVHDANPVYTAPRAHEVRRGAGQGALQGLDRAVLR